MFKSAMLLFKVKIFRTEIFHLRNVINDQIQILILSGETKYFVKMQNAKCKFTLPVRGSTKLKAQELALVLRSIIICSRSGMINVFIFTVI